MSMYKMHNMLILCPEVSSITRHTYLWWSLSKCQIFNIQAAVLVRFLTKHFIGERCFQCQYVNILIKPVMLLYHRDTYHILLSLISHCVSVGLTLIMLYQFKVSAQNLLFTLFHICLKSAMCTFHHRSVFILQADWL